jgi:amino acid transporter
LSSVAYATEAILVALAAGGLGFYRVAPYLSVQVAALFVIVTASYRQTCHAYPSGGGFYIVSHQNLGRSAGLVAASALLVDYVMTVAVSVVAGVSAITSALPATAPHAVAISIGFVVLLMVVNLRGVRETGISGAGHRTRHRPARSVLGPAGFRSGLHRADRGGSHQQRGARL